MSYTVSLFNGTISIRFTRSKRICFSPFFPVPALVPPVPAQSFRPPYLGMKSIREKSVLSVVTSRLTLLETDGEGAVADAVLGVEEVLPEVLCENTVNPQHHVDLLDGALKTSNIISIVHSFKGLVVVSFIL